MARAKLPLIVSHVLVILQCAFVGSATTTCVVEPAPNGADSAPAILRAFDECGHDGKIIFKNETYHVGTVMNTTGLQNCAVEINGTLLWSTDIDYWLENSLPMGYQNQSTAWLFGGTNVSMNGFGIGTFDGNGQVWYDFNAGRSNVLGRPHAITYSGVENLVVRGMRYVQSQMWTMTVIHAENALLEDIYVNSTSSNGNSTINTDGADTIYANNVTFRRWTIANGDDSLSPKANSTNILMEDCDFYDGIGIAIGSIGQYDGVFERIENVTARNIRINFMRHAARVKTWTGVSKGIPPNGGGGGLGYASNLHFSNFSILEAEVPWAINQCTSYNGQRGGCDSSLFNIHNVTVENWQGRTAPWGDGVVGSMQCSASSPCTNIAIENMDLADEVSGKPVTRYLCDNLQGPIGFVCTGSTGSRSSSQTGWSLWEGLKAWLFGSGDLFSQSDVQDLDL